VPIVTDAAIWAGTADALAPPERLRPSEWAEKYRELKEGTTDQPGRWSNSYFPWLAPIMDARVDFPHKKGQIFQKCGQIGGSERAVNNVGWSVCTRPGPMLFLTTTDNQAKEFSRDRFDYMIESAPILKTRQLTGPKNRDTVHVKRFAGAKLAICGSGSPSKLMSEPYQVVYLDEVDQLPIFPRVGSAWKLAEIRMRTFRRSWLDAWSTSTYEDRGIAKQYKELSDQRRFFVACPHCGTWDWLKFGQVRIEERKAATAKYICEHCEEEISDIQRAAAVYGGEYRSTLPEKQAAERSFVGFQIGRQYDPYLPLIDLAGAYVSCRTEAELQVFHNADLGEPFSPSSTPVGVADLDARQMRTPNEPAPADTQFITAGIDVQSKLTFYFDVSAWTSDGLKHLLQYGRVQGWERLRTFLRGFEIDKQGAQDRLGIRLAAVDAGYETTQVYNFCMAVGVNFVIPVKYGPSGHAAHWRLVKVATARNIGCCMLDRGYWMDRAMGRFGGGDELAGVVTPMLSDEYRAHVLSPKREVIINPRGGYEKVVWTKDSGLHDDYLQAAVYAEFAAMRCGLDRLQREGEAFKQARKALRVKNEEIEQGWVSRGYRKTRGTWLGRPKGKRS